jgi:Fe2+ transport system protein FeoA
MSAEAENAEPLSGLLPGQRGRIVAVNVADSNKGRILEMGLTVGATIEVVRFAPLGDPMELKVRGAHISLRKAEASGVRVQRI